MQIIGALLNNPLILGDIGTYTIIPVDFNDKFSRNIFMAISNLFQVGAMKITPIDVDNFLSKYDMPYKNFSENNGITYLQDCEDMFQYDSFDYYYSYFKKLSALRALKKEGFNIKKIYPDGDDYDITKEQDMLEYFEQLSISSIFDIILHDFTTLQYDYVGKANATSMDASYELANLKEALKLSPEIGRPLQGDIYNTSVRGARKGKFYLSSGSTGSGKSRRMISNACYLSYPEMYDLKLKQWVYNGACEKSVIITTELDYDEVQTIILAYLSGVNEERILSGRYEIGEEDRIDYAIQVTEKYKGNLIIESIPDPSIAQLTTVIRKHHVQNKIVNVFYDYIFSSPSLLNEFRDLRVREDVALMMLSTALKDLAKNLGIFIMSGTQLNAQWKDHKGIRNEHLIRGAKSICDKIDVGSISMEVTREEREFLKPTLEQINVCMPTHVTDIFKVRRGRYKDIRIWSIIDLGTMRVEDLFMTDSDYKPIKMNIVKAEVDMEAIEKCLLEKESERKESTKEYEQKSVIIEPIIEVEEREASRETIDLNALI
jgi:replicative DNA helicase